MIFEQVEKFWLVIAKNVIDTTSHLVRKKAIYTCLAPYNWRLRVNFVGSKSQDACSVNISIDALCIDD